MEKKIIICLYSFCFNDQHQYNVSGFVCFFKESRHGQKKKTKGKKNWTRSSIYTHTVEENKKEQKKTEFKKKRQIDDVHVWFYVYTRRFSFKASIRVFI
jgi:hypothetical protein